MIFVGVAAKDGGLCMRKGMARVYDGRIARGPVSRPGKPVSMVRPMALCKNDGVGGPVFECGSVEEAELRLAAMGLRLRRFPCDSYPGSWRLYGTEDIP